MTSRMRSRSSPPILLPKIPLSSVTILETFTTLCSESPPSPGTSRTLPGSFARLRTVVNSQTTTVRMGLLLKSSLWITKT